MSQNKGGNLWLLRIYSGFGIVFLAIRKNGYKFFLTVFHGNRILKISIWPLVKLDNKRFDLAFS